MAGPLKEKEKGKRRWGGKKEKKTEKKENKEGRKREEGTGFLKHV